MYPSILSRVNSNVFNKQATILMLLKKGPEECPFGSLLAKGTILQLPHLRNTRVQMLINHSVVLRSSKKACVYSSHLACSSTIPIEHNVCQRDVHRNCCDLLHQ